MSERLAKFLARSGVCSRRAAEELIKQGRITVNGETIETPAFLVEDADTVLFDGEKIKQKDKTRLWLYHKPAGLITSHADEKDRATVFNNLPAGLPRVISVGRLDLNSEGLLLLTNDGALSRALELPSNGWSRRYRVRVHGIINEKKLKSLENGTTIDGVTYAPAKITIDSKQN
ncbi:MAG: rRNA pseudouridine synthase, partial [Alphaproteobacteria bacterium]|nr:rRNA pseudouridine synthase [Alphaproteobacteria bacterium]